MESPQQLIDSLTSHIALFHSNSPSSNRNPNPRSSILRWLSSLPAITRQSVLTFTDLSFARILLQMRAHLDSNGPTLFFLLPDVPSADGCRRHGSLPSLCSRRAHGVLARTMSVHVLSDSLLLFGSRDENVLDSVTFSEDLMADVDGFVKLMDEVSGGRFLRGDEGGLAEEWKEMSWLKDKGYYSLEELVANQVEVVLRRSWGGVSGKKGKGKVKGGAAVGESVFWRKKGCVDWWTGLDPGRRKEFCLGFLGKAAKSLANEIVEGQDTTPRNYFCSLDVEAKHLENFDPTASRQRSNMAFLKRDSDASWDDVTCSGMPHHLVKLLNRLLVVQKISALVLACQLDKVEKGALFFSRLGSAFTVSDCIMRKLRGLIMVVSIDYISQELLGDEKLKTLPNKNEEKKLSMACRKEKKKSRNSKQINSMPNSSRVVSTLPELKVRNEGKIDCVADNSYNLCNQEYNYPVAANQETESANTCLLPRDPGTVNLEHAIGLVNCKHPADRKRNRGRGAKRKNSNLKKVVEPEIENQKTSIPLVAAETKLEGAVATSTLLPVSRDFTARATLSAMSSSCNGYGEPSMVDNNKMTDNALVDCSFPTADSHSGDFVCCSGSDKLEDGATKFASASLAKDAYEKNPQGTSQCSVANSHTDCKKQSDPDICPGITSVCDKTCFPFPTSEGNQCKLQSSGLVNGKPLEPIPSKFIYAAVNEQSSESQNNGIGSCIPNRINTMGGISYEWPRTNPFDLASANSPHLPAATDRLHLEVGHKQSNLFHHSFMQSRNQPRNSATEVGYGRILPSLTLPMSYDWPPVIKNCGRFNQAMTISYDSAFNPPLPASFSSGFAAHATLGMQVNGASNENDRKHAGDIFDVYDLKTASEFPDDAEGYWLSEEESDTHAFSGRDYNQFFGGGVMYWNPAEHVGTGFSRPPSYSSEDSSWAWYEADLNRAIDDMVGMPGLPTSFSTNGLASPPTAAFCSPFDPLASGHQQIGYTVPGNDGGKILQSSSSASDFGEEKSSVSLNNSPGCVEGVKGDTVPYPVLRPIIIPSISKKGSRSEFKVNQDHRSPCLPSNRRDHPRIKRPPSPVVLCVPRVPRPPPPSPVGESRKRGFPIVRSGSSSPRHWGVRSSCHEDGNADDPRLCLDGAEVVWPSWRAKGLVGTPVAQSIQGSLLQNHLMKISQLACDQEHPDVALPLQPPDASNSPHRASLSMLQNRLHEEIEFFCKQVASENLIKKPYINWAIKRVTRSLQVLWPRSRTNIFGSNATGLALPTSDVDLVVSLPPVRNLEPIKEAGILEGRNGIKETCLQHAARYLGNQDWVRNDSLKTIENTAIPIIMLVVEVPQDINYSNGNSSVLELQDTQSSNMSVDSASHLDHLSSEDTSSGAFSKTRMDDGSRVKSIRLDISFKSSSHTGLQTSELVRELTQQFPASVPLALVLKKFLADRSLDHSYSGGLSSYCLAPHFEQLFMSLVTEFVHVIKHALFLKTLQFVTIQFFHRIKVLLITRFLQHEHHICRPINQNLGSLLMDFLYFFGNVFDPRQMRISIQGSGVYMNRERGHSIDPIHIDDPLFPSNNVGRNCFRIHQCIKAFADAYSTLESELSHFSDDCGPCSTMPFEILRKIIPSID